MRKLTLVLSLLLVLFVPVTGFSSDKSDNLFVIVTTDDEMTQLMSMVLAVQSMKQGAAVNVLLCGEAGALAVAGSPEKVLKPLNKSPQMLLKNLIDKGSGVEICPLYLPNSDKTEADLLTGISVANPSQIAEKLLQKNTKILTY